MARRASEAKVIYWHPAEAMPTDLFSYLREASSCYDLAQFIATIFLSSALVELILNRDSRTAGGHWLALNNRNLRVASNEGLPVNELLDAGENVTSGRPVRFVDLRNKVAHGNLADFPPGQLSDYSPAFEAAAKGQLDKASRFLVAWFNTRPDL